MSHDVLGRRQVFSAPFAKTIEVHFVEDHVRIVTARPACNAIELERTRRAFVHGVSSAPIQHRAGEARFDEGRRESLCRSVESTRRAPVFDGQERPERQFRKFALGVDRQEHAYVVVFVDDRGASARSHVSGCAREPTWTKTTPNGPNDGGGRHARKDSCRNASCQAVMRAGMSALRSVALCCTSDG